MPPMAKVESWFPRFSQSLVRRLPRADWPAPTCEFWDEVRSFLVHKGATEEVAREAMSILAEDPPKFLDNVIPSFRGAIEAVWKRAEAADAPAGGTFAEAQAASRHCPDCSGMGQVVVFHRSVLRSIAAHCECAAGRWLHANRTKDLPEPERRRYLRLLDVKAGIVPYVLDQPRLESLADAAGRPLPEVWAANNPPAGPARKPGRAGLGELVPVVPIPPRPMPAPAPEPGPGPEPGAEPQPAAGYDPGDDSPSWPRIVM
jgi:hypothetical protein